MRAVEIVFAVGWAAFWIYWIAAAVSMKRGRTPWGREMTVRFVIILVVLGLVRLHVFRGHGVSTDPARSAIGLVLFGAGLAFAVWARLHIGRNWGMPMSRKDEPELVTSGPYRRVRHPIYTGILTAALGTALALNWIWLIGVGLAAAYFVYSATVEERNLSAEFPDAYRAYRSTSKMIVPFVL